MFLKKSIHGIMLVALVVLVLATPKPALAWSGCASSYFVRHGDTLWSISNSYGTTVAAMRQANPSLGYWIYAGQTLCLPDGYQGNSYGYQSGGYDYQSTGYNNGQQNCYGNCNGNNYGNSYGNSYSNGYDNGYMNNGYNNGYMNNGYNNGYASYTAPSGGDGTYCVRYGDTLKKIAARYGTSVGNLLALNPQIWNPNWIYAGQVIRLW